MDRPTNLSIKVSAAEHARFRDVAEAHETTIAAVVRLLVRREAERLASAQPYPDLADPPADPRALPETAA